MRLEALLPSNSRGKSSEPSITAAETKPFVYWAPNGTVTRFMQKHQQVHTLPSRRRYIEMVEAGRFTNAAALSPGYGTKATTTRTPLLAA